MSDEFDPLLEDDIDGLDPLAPKKKGLTSDEDDIFGDEISLDDEDPFMADLGYGFGAAEDDDAY